MAKSKVIVSKNTKNWASFTLKNSYLVRVFIFIFISTCCVHHAVHYALQLGKSFQPNLLKSSFPVPDLTPGSKYFLRFDDWIK